MPLYDYTCRACGDFRELRTVDQRNCRTPCPQCRVPAQRVIKAPNLAIMNPLTRKAAFINERSRHEPRVSEGHVCGKAVRKNNVRQTRLGTLQAGKPSARPWMLGH